MYVCVYIYNNDDVCIHTNIASYGFIISIQFGQGGLSCNCLGTPTSLTGALCQEPQEWLKSVKKGRAFFGLGLDLSSQQLVAVTVFMQL